MDPQTPPTQATQNPARPQPTIPAKQAGLISPDRLYQSQNGDNLMHATNIVDIGTPRNGWKLALLDVFAVIFAAAFGYSFARYLAGGFSFWYAFTSLLLWCALSMLEGFLEKDIARRFLVLLLETIAVVAFFYAYAWQAIAIAALLVATCLFLGYLSVRRELRNTIEMRFFTASGKVVGKVITAAAIFMVVMYASVANSNGNFFISPNSFNLLFDWSAGFVHNFYPNVSLTDSFGSFAQSVAQMQLQGNTTFQSLTPAAQSAAVTQSVDQIAATFSDAPSTTDITTTTLAISMALAEPTSDVFYSYFAALTAKLQDKFGTAFIGIWALGLFLILRSIGIIVVWVAQFVSLIFYELLLALGFMKISEQPATKEIIEL